MINLYDRASFSQYTPLSAQEILMPAQMMRERHDKLDEEYSAINDNMQKAAFIAQNDSDPTVRANYENLVNKLNTIRDELMNNGITNSSRRNMFNLRGDYQNKITPLLVGQENKMKLNAMTQEMRLKDPTLMIEDYSNRSVKDFVNGDFTPKNYSGTVIAKQVGEAAKNLSDLLNTDPSFKGILEDELGYQYVQMIQQRGLRPEDLENSPTLQRILDQTLESTGIKN